MVLPSIHNLLAKLDSTFDKDSTDTNFYQLLQMVAYEIDSARRELQFTKTDNYFYQVRDDQLFNNLGALLKINKQPFFTKRKTLSFPLRLVIEEDLATRPKCLTENLVKISIEWTTELDSTTEIDYTDRSPFIIPGSADPSTGLFDAINETQLITIAGNRGKKHFATIYGRKFSSTLFFRVRSTNVVGEIRQSEFVELQLPNFPLIAPIVTTENPPIQDAAGETIRVPLEDDLYGFRQYRKILYGVLSSYLTGPTQKGVEIGIQPFYDFPIEVVENFPAIPDLYETNAIQQQDEILVHTFQISVIINDIDKARDLGELNEQVQNVLEFIKPAHVLPFFQYVFPDHFFCPSDNPFGIKKAIALEPTVGPCGEKVYINPTNVDLGVNAYYQDVLGYRLYCDYTTNYFGIGCYTPYNRNNYYFPYGYNNNYNTDIIGRLNGYYDVLDRNYFYIQNGQRAVMCPFVKNRQVELILEHRNGTDPTSIYIDGDVEAGGTTFQNIPFSKSINVVLTKGNGSKTIHVKFTYPEQTRTNDSSRRINTTRLGPGCHGEVTVDAVTFLLNTLPEDCCAEEYIDDIASIDGEITTSEKDVLKLNHAFRLGDLNSTLNGTRTTSPISQDKQKRGLNLDGCLMTNVKNRRLNTREIGLRMMHHPIPEVQIETFVCDSFDRDTLILNSYKKDKINCNKMPRVLNRSRLTRPDKEFFKNPGYITATEYRGDRAFILNGVEGYRGGNPYTVNGTRLYRRNTERFFNISSLNKVGGAVMAPIKISDVEPWNRHLFDTRPCPSAKITERCLPYRLDSGHCSPAEQCPGSSNDNQHETLDEAPADG